MLSTENGELKRTFGPKERECNRRMEKVAD
jgi:hypothetical protein